MGGWWGGSGKWCGVGRKGWELGGRAGGQGYQYIQVKDPSSNLNLTYDLKFSVTLTLT